jgi:CBS domain-containing protein
MTITARDLMTTDVVTVRSHQSLEELAHLLQDKRISGCPVLDSEGQIVGVVSTTDLVRDSQEGIEGAFFRFAMGFGEDLLEADPWDAAHDKEPGELILKHQATDTVAAVMTRKVYAVEASATVGEVAKEMLERRVHRLVVNDDGVFVGLISATDLLRHLAGRG